MKIVIPDDYQDMVGQLECFSLIRHHDVARYREPARDLAKLTERLRAAERRTLRDLGRSVGAGAPQTEEEGRLRG